MGFTFCAPSLSLRVQLRDESVDLRVTFGVFLDIPSNIPGRFFFFFFGSSVHPGRASVKQATVRDKACTMCIGCSVVYNICHRLRIIGSKVTPPQTVTSFKARLQCPGTQAQHTQTRQMLVRQHFFDVIEMHSGIIDAGIISFNMAKSF